jgi:predicted subunit of tRNA(5-methylaminomethyl-2-thiouridylate) methyltransferase
VVHEGAYSMNVAGGVVGGVPGGVAGYMDAAAPKSPPPPPPAIRQAQPRREVAASTVVANASGQELGELFEYRIAQPVTIRKNESAMLPFLQQPIAGRKLLIYSDHGSQHPTNAAELTNSTGKTLDGGPITVYDGGVYGGEALMETLKAGDKRLISYAVDLGTRITEAFGSKQAVTREMHATRGLLSVKYAMEETRTYTIRNVDQKAKTLILEHPLRQGYTLLNRQPAEKTPSAYRFDVPLAAGASQEFVVNEERVYEQSYAVVSMTPDSMLQYIQNRVLSDAARRQLQRIADQKSKIAANDRELQIASSQVREVTSDEDRIRQNIQSLNAVSGQQQQVQTYARQLDQHEQQLAGLRDRQAELQKQKAALQAELDRLIEELQF